MSVTTMPRVSPPVPSDTDTEGEEEIFPLLVSSDSDVTEVTPSGHDIDTNELKTCISVIDSVCFNRKHRYVGPLRYMAQHYQQRFTFGEMESMPELRMSMVGKKGERTHPALFKSYVNRWIRDWGYKVHSNNLYGGKSRYEYWIDKAEANVSSNHTAKRSRTWDYEDLDNNDAVQSYMAMTPLEHIKRHEEVTKRLRVLEAANVEAIQKTLSAVQAERDMLRGQVNKITEERDAWQAKVADANDHNEKLEKQLETSETHVNALGERVKEMESSNLRLKATQQRLEAEKAALQESVKINSDQAISNSREVNRLKSELDKVNGRVMEMGVEKNSLKERLQHIKNYLGA